MEFGPVPLSQAEGAVLAHSARVAGGRKIGKGTVLAAGEIAALAAAGIAEVTVARLGPDDVGEDRAAARVAAAMVPDPGAARLTVTAPHAGRVNFHATEPGVIDVDAEAIHALNRIDPDITFATLAPFTRVTPGMLAGTVKIIAYGVGGGALARAEDAARGAIRVRPVTVGTVSLILTEAPGQEAKLNAKGRAAVAARLQALGIALTETVTVAHDEAAIAAAIAAAGGGMVLVLTGAATSDLHDDGPQALRRAGGRVERFGMPVDPGNLLFLGSLGERPVIGLPGCARSPALNGADWVLERLACGIAVSGEDIARMGVGGLLKEIPVRGQLREGRD